ncbi:hypothetical protein AJ88_24375 [Mesorhizobium amorphae CCBAU 01583]|nr:hypothetical protein AJ88_24375 [Mesorhizobium amorphae CCBAU 01583]
MGEMSGRTEGGAFPPTLLKFNITKAKFDHVDKTQAPFHSSLSDIPENSRLDTAVSQRGTS